MIEIGGLLGDFREDRRFCSDAGKPARDRWVFEHWCRRMGKESSAFVQGEGPDFCRGQEYVEITEAVPPGCRRQDEFKKAESELLAGKSPQPWDSVSLEEVLMGGHCWVLNAIAAKARKYRSAARGWVLVVYVNFSFWQRVCWDLVKSQLGASPPPFECIDALSADGSQVILLFSPKNRHA